MIWLLLACSSEPDAPSEESRRVSPRELRRISLALTGTLPSLADYEQLQSEDSIPDSLIESYLATAEHENRMKELFSEWLLTRTDHFNLSHVEVTAYCTTKNKQHK